MVQIAGCGGRAGADASLVEEGRSPVSKPRNRSAASSRGFVTGASATSSTSDGQQLPQVGSLRLVAAQLDGAGQLGATLLDPAGPEQQLPAGAGQPVPGQLQAFEQREAGVRSVGLGDGDRAVEPDDGGAGRAARARGSARRCATSRCPRRFRAMACSAAISAWRRYGVPGACAHGVSRATASSISACVPRVAVLVGQQYQSAAASTRASRRECWSSIRASSESSSRVCRARPRGAPAPAGSPRRLGRRGARRRRSRGRTRR